MQPETRLFPLGDKSHWYVMLGYDHISRTIGNYFFFNLMHSLSVLENLGGLCVTVSVSRSLCHGLCVTVSVLRSLCHGLCVTVSVLRSLCYGLCVTVSVLRSLCHSLCVTVDFLVLLSSLSLCSVILACYFTLYFCVSSHVVGSFCVWCV